MPKTKIICTLGPSSGDKSILKKMIDRGMDVARLNFSHGKHETHQKHIDIIQNLNKINENQIKILQDLEGYRIRIGKFNFTGKKEISLKKGQTVNLRNIEISEDKAIIPFDYHGDLTGIKKGCYIYIDDGNIALKVKESSQKHIKAEVITPGIVKENKGINIPNMDLKFQGLTEKDKSDLQIGINNNVDFVAQSFVRSKADLINIREFLKKYDFQPKIIAKIENRRGIDNIEEILEHSDGIMIARGDMGVSLPIYQVPVMQKTIIRKCNYKDKPAITATQMLETMTENLRPTRAEVSDVANAVLDGSNYLMLSGETAVGKHPAKVVEMMDNIIEFTERSLLA